MNAIVLPAGTTHVHFEELVDLIADALFPYTGPDDARLRAGYALANIGEELDMDARAGKLLLRNELTLGPHQVPRGEKIVNALVAVNDLRDYVRERKLTVIVESSEAVLDTKRAIDELQTVPSSPANSPSKSPVPQAGPLGPQAETAQQRQARRYHLCTEAGLKMPTNDYAPLPRGIGKLAKREGITRQSFSEDVKAHINRLNPPRGR